MSLNVYVRRPFLHVFCNFTEIIIQAVNSKLAMETIWTLGHFSAGLTPPKLILRLMLSHLTSKISTHFTCSTPFVFL